MKIDIVTIFPELFANFLETSIVKKAISRKQFKIKIHNLRDYSDLPHQQVDDTPYGGGAGMLMMYPPIYRVLKKLQTKKSFTIILTPQGKTFHQQLAKKLSLKKHLIIICGRYEGYDERVFDYCDMELSIGDFILMGGELPAMTICEAIIRLLPDVIENESVITDTFENNLLKYPQYTKPFSFNGKDVPNILVSGHHENIRKWRLEKSILKTKQRRPDLYKLYKEGQK